MTEIPPEAMKAAVDAIYRFRYIPDMGDGHSAIRMGTPEQLAEVALIAAAPLLIQADRKRREQEAISTCVHPDVIEAIEANPNLLDAYDRVSARSFVAGVKVGQELERDSQGKDQTE